MYKSHLIAAGVVVATALSANPAQATPYTLTHTVDNPMPGIDASFGYAVAVSGGTAIIGANRGGGGGINDGVAYLVDTGTGAVTHTLSSTAVDNRDQFGFSVAIDGNKAVVGSRLEDDNRGKAYVFDTTTGALVSTLVDPLPGVEDQFGVSVDISGNTVVVGTPFNDTSFTGPTAFAVGEAYVFDAISGALLHTLVNPLFSALDYFGNSVAIDGNLIAVAARNEDVAGENEAGAVHLFDALTGGFLHTLQNPFPNANDNFGIAVDVEDGQVLVGARFDDESGAANSGAAFLFDGASGNLLHTFDNPFPSIGDEFGSSVSLSDGIAAIGAYRASPGGINEAGSAYLFDTITGNLLQSIANPFPQSGDNFGGARKSGVALDGGTLIVGAFQDDAAALDSGQAYIFQTGVSVPAPGGLMLLGIGLLGLGIRRRAA